MCIDGADQLGRFEPVMEDDFSNINWALQFGAGIDFLFLTADIRYELGLNNIYKAPDYQYQISSDNEKQCFLHQCRLEDTLIFNPV